MALNPVIFDELICVMGAQTATFANEFEQRFRSGSSLPSKDLANAQGCQLQIDGLVKHSALVSCSTRALRSNLLRGPLFHITTLALCHLSQWVFNSKNSCEACQAALPLQHAGFVNEALVRQTVGPQTYSLPTGFKNSTAVTCTVECQIGSSTVKNCDAQPSPT